MSKLKEIKDLLGQQMNSIGAFNLQFERGNQS